MINIENLNFTYPGGKAPVLDDLSFNIQRGEVFGLLGPSGSGKSTTQKIMMGLLRGFSGTAKIFDQSIANFSSDFYQRIGVSFELPALYLRLTAKENLEMFAALYAGQTRDPMDVLDLVDLKDAADQRVETFSKGMKMRLNLCRALLHDPELLFLDEPTTGQDPARARITQDLILRLKEQGKTIFLTTHNMLEADQMCDRVGFLSHGKISVIGAPDDLKRRYGKREVELRFTSNSGQSPVRFPISNIAENQDFQASLKHKNLATIHTLEASLDDLFIKATGTGDKR